MRNGYPDLSRELGADLVHLESREETYYCVGHPGADGSYRVTLRGIGVSKAVEPPTDTLDRLFSLKLPKPVVGDAQRLKLAGTKEIADASFVKGLLIEIGHHS